MPSIQNQLKSVAVRSGLTIYGISQIVGAETDEPLKTIHQRWSRWLKGESLGQVQRLEADLAALGYSLKIEKQ